MKKNKTITKEYSCTTGAIRIDILDDFPCQIQWKSPAGVDDKGKTRTPAGWHSLRLWYNQGQVFLSQGIKGLFGTGDIIIRRDIKEDTLISMSSMKPDEIAEALFNLKGDLYDMDDVYTNPVIPVIAEEE